MAIYALALSHCKPFSTPLKQNYRSCPVNQHHWLKSCNQLSQNCSFSFQPPASSFNCRTGSYEFSSKRSCNFKVRSAAVPESRNELTKKIDERIRILQLGFMFAIWYLLNIYFNIFNKQVQAFFPLLLSFSFLIHVM